MKTDEKSTPLGMSIAPNFSSFEIKTVLPLNTGIASVFSICFKSK
jgi:hypothetical protein